MATQQRQIQGVLDELVEVDSYEDRHRPEHQDQVGQGYPINPVLRVHFSSTPNDHRVPQELEDWWGLPYIRSTTWQQIEADIRRGHEKQKSRLTPTEAEAEIEADRADFLSFNPDGVRYTVLCLDGGAWDRPTKWGVFPSLDDAIACCENGPAWRQAQRTQN